MDQEKSLRLLEFHKIRSLLAAAADTEGGRAGCMALMPFTDPERVRGELARTQAALRILNVKGPLSMRGLRDISGAIERLRVEAPLSIPELMDCAFLLRTARRLREYRGEGEALESVLDDEFERLAPHRALEDRLYASFNAEGEVMDAASDELYRIRRQIASAQSRIRENLDKLIRSAQYARCLQEPVVTVRGGRFVVPVKVEYKGEISGLIHDVSATGATVFVEPASVVEANNEVRLLEGREKAEIERILYELSALLTSVCEDLEENFLLCTRFDELFAKAKLAVDMRATMPLVNDRGIVDLRRARHPLLDRDTVVPVDVALGQDYDTLVITGPNTGGKTVSLKLVGLVCAMAQAGLYIPCAEESRCPVFDMILTDVGDEQSIEQSLSTFSSHMTNIIQIIDRATARSLCLFDELGAGTDPVEGAALAMAILEALRLRGARVAATTHYAELKEYALKTAGVENACCEFDVATLRPTYRLLIGVPGRSNAFAISERLGMERGIVERAKELVSAENARFEDVVQSLEESRQKLEAEREETRKLREETERLRRETQERSEKQQRDSEAQLEQARTEARNLVARARAQADALLDELDSLRKQKKELSPEEKARLRAGIRSMENAADPVREKQGGDYVLPRPLKAGDPVLIFDIDKKGTVLEPTDASGNVLVQAGIIKTRVPQSNLRLLKESQVKKPQRSVTRNVKGALSAPVTRELDLRGQTTVEALMELDRFIDSAQLSGVGMLTVIHGKGTGALRAAVHQHLKKHPSVRSYRLGVYGEGEAGVTIVELK